MTENASIVSSASSSLEQTVVSVCKQLQEAIVDASHKSCVAQVAATIDISKVAEEINYRFLAACIDCEEVSRHLDLEEVASSVQVDTHELGDKICMSTLASEISLRELASEICMSDLACELDATEVAGEVCLRSLASEISLCDLAAEIDLEVMSSEFVTEYMPEVTKSVVEELMKPESSFMNRIAELVAAKLVDKLTAPQAPVVIDIMRSDLVIAE